MYVRGMDKNSLYPLAFIYVCIEVADIPKWMMGISNHASFAFRHTSTDDAYQFLPTGPAIELESVGT
jgi:hypothetical protein